MNLYLALYLMVASLLYGAGALSMITWKNHFEKGDWFWMVILCLFWPVMVALVLVEKLKK